MRVIITGSRHWTDKNVIKAALEKLPADTVVVHGAAKGADYIAGEVAKELGFTVEEYPADWNQHGRRAGPIRNQQMVNLGADLVLAFPLPGSLGTWNCVNKAKTAGIKVEVL